MNLNLSIHSSSSSPENSDDFVLVPKNLPTDEGVVNYERKYVKCVYSIKISITDPLVLQQVQSTGSITGKEHTS